MTMTARFVMALLAGAVVAVVLVVTLATGDPYEIRVPLENASGLRDGSEVRVGGKAVGKVKLELDDEDRLFAVLQFDDDPPRIDKDVKVAVKAANFFGIKRMELLPSPDGEPAPDGWLVPRENVASPADLDQVLGVLDARTRTALQVVIAEAGQALLGRKVDLRRFLQEFPVGEREATALLNQLKTGNATMRRLLERADGFVAEAAKERRELTRMISALGTTAETLAQRRAALRQTLARTPGALRTLQGFAADLRATATELGPAARELAATGPGLAATLAEVEGFRRAAEPALGAATTAAPQLARLGERATPVLHQTAQTASHLVDLSDALRGVTDTLDGSVENIFATLENWSRAIQFRDQLGHVFRGEASFTPDIILSAIRRLAPRRSGGDPDEKLEDRPDRELLEPYYEDEAERGEGDAPEHVRRSDEPAGPRLDRLVQDLADKALGGILDLLPKGVLERLGRTLGENSERDGADRPGGASRDTVSQLLDYLLGR